MFLDEKPSQIKYKKKKTIAFTQERNIVLNQQEEFQTTGYLGILKNESYEIEVYHELKRSDIQLNYLKSIKPEEWDSNKGIIIEKCTDKITPNDFEYMYVLQKSQQGGDGNKLTQVRYKKNGKIYTMKTIKKSKLKDEVHIDCFETERYIYEKLHHPFLINLHFAFQTEYKLYLILDCLKEGRLDGYIQLNGGFSEEEAKFYFAQVYLLFVYFHSKNIIYRELCTENVYLTSNGYIKIGEVSKAEANIKDYDCGANSICGVKEYQSPEMLQTNQYGKGTDIWTMGIFLYEMLFINPPFTSKESSHRNTISKTIVFNDLKFDEDNDKKINNDAKDLLKKILMKKPQDRIKLEEIKDHPFMRGVDLNMIYQMKAKPFNIPILQGENDFLYIDPDNQNENPKDSLYTGCSPIIKDHFEGFSFDEELN